MKVETIRKKLNNLVATYEEGRQVGQELRGMVERNLDGEILEVTAKGIVFTRKGKKYLLRLEE